MLKRLTLKRCDLVALRACSREDTGIVIETYDYPNWPCAKIYIFKTQKMITVNQSLYGLRKVT